jgi:DNA-directed RNA polymerase
MQTFTGTEYIKIDLANQFGLDRLAWQERLWWVSDNRPDMAALSEQAKSKIAFDKALRALVHAENGSPTNHIMGLDATASGIQVMAAMSGCRSSAKAVNLINTGNREDVYDSMSNEMSNLIDMKIERNTIKKPVMTFFYGSMAVPKQIFGAGKELKAFYNALAMQLPGPYELMKIFQSFWDPCATDYQWAMPDGHVVHVPVTSKEEKGLEIDEADHLRFTYRAEVVKPQLQGRSLAANIVHSVDAWICREMVKRTTELGFYMAPIHDNFYAHPNHMDVVRQLYRECMAEVAEINLVTMILSQIAGRNVSYSKISNDLSNDILESEYALS